MTIPRSVREALSLEEGDELPFRVERSRAVIAKTPDFLELAGTIAVPAGKRGTPWDEVLRAIKTVDAAALLLALEVYELHRLDFAEAYLVAQAEATGVNEVLSFDRSIDRLESVTRREP